MTTETIPTLTTTDEALAFMRDLAETHDWVSVFWDRGWGDSGQVAEISVIVDGDGQQPKAYLTAEVYKQLRADRSIPENTLKTFKARRLHDFKTPPEPEPTVTANDVAETVVRDLIAAMPDAPIYAEFYRGLDPNSRTPSILHEYASTPTYDGRGWFVRILPGCSDAAISAAAAPQRYFGPDLLGEVVCLDYPKVDGEVDTSALLGAEFRARLREVVEGKLAEIEAARSAS
jgi:hypothetical protein